MVVADLYLKSERALSADIGSGFLFGREHGFVERFIFVFCKSGFAIYNGIIDYNYTLMSK